MHSLSKFALALGLGATVTAAGFATHDAMAAAGETGDVRGVIQLKKGRRLARDHAGVVVVVHGVPGDDQKPPKKPFEVEQRNKQFAPQVAAVVKGTTVSFPNEDRVFHNVFSVSRAARFDLGLYRAGTTKSVDFDRAGVVDVYCNIHPEMAAKVFVLDSTYYALTGPAGRFEIKDVPPGTYPVEVLQANGDGYEGQITVPAGGTAQLNLELETKRGNDDHLRKDGTPYGRYQ